MGFSAAVITFPGSNCDRDMATALEAVAGAPALRVWHGDADLPERLDLIALPGGFSYGDYLRSGAMAATSPIMRAVIAAAERGVPVLGVCNGFQVLTEARLLPGALLRNAGQRFICRTVGLTVENTASMFRQSAFRSRIMMAISSPTMPRWIGWKAKAASRSAMPNPATGRRAILPGC
jgi:phosphoribosylformylglycinamidine synthase subunit PurQ / glutaminase